MSATSQCLLLNADYKPYQVIPWRRAIDLILDDKADLVAGYVDKWIRSVSEAIAWPAVLRLREFVDPRPRLRFNRLHVLARDNHTCAYCGAQPRTQAGLPRVEDLTLDHVIPRAQSRNGQVVGIHGRRISVTCWENVVTACSDCNITKADRTPGQAGMKLRFLPKAPSRADVLRMTMTLRKVHIPDEWKDYLPAGAEAWGGYWTDELES